MALILVRYWFAASNAADAAFYQIDLFEDLLLYRRFEPDLADAVIKRLQCHLWMSSPEFVVFGLASSKLLDVEKERLAAAILSQPRNELKPGKVAMPPLSQGASLASRVSNQSPYFFKSLGVGFGFLHEPVSDWEKIPAFLKFKAFIDTFPLTNDHTERVIKRTSDYINYGSKKDEDFQAVLQTVGNSIENVPNRINKQALISSYSSM